MQKIYTTDRNLCIAEDVAWDSQYFKAERRIAKLRDEYYEYSL